jgi:pantoate--beta-alanine ligase
MSTVVKHIKDMQSTVQRLREENKRIGFVPTMGALHRGHLSLIDVARRRADVVVTSIFVNPTQFGSTEDFKTYPRDLTLDAKLASDAGSEYVFAPEAKEMYPEGFVTLVDVTRISEGLEGKFRPGHFRGVATVVAKLFNITQPHLACFGQKDAQQVVVIRRMIQDLNFDIELVVCPIVRDEDGVALSSRNVFLSAEQRRQASALSRSLSLAERSIRDGERNAARVIAAMSELIKSDTEGVIDYVSVADSTTLEEQTVCEGNLLISLAVRFGGTRLIDNTILKV